VNLRGSATELRCCALATSLLFAALAGVFFTQDPIEARHRPWTGPHVSEDGWYYYYYLRSAVLDGDLNLDNEYRDVGNWYGFGVTRTGRPHNPFGIGPALFWAPGFLIGHAIATIQSRAGTAVADGMSGAEQTGALFTSFLAAALAFWLAFRLARRYTTAHAAWLGTAVAFLGGPLVWYAVYSPSMPHALEALFGAAFFTELLPFRRRTWPEAVRLGVIGGAAMLVRPQLAMLLVLLPFEAAVMWRRGETRSTFAMYAAIGVTALLIFSPQLLLWKHVYGSYIVVPQGTGFLRFSESCWSETLFASRNGLFTTTPVLWFVLPGLYLAFRHDRRLGSALLATLFLAAFVNGAAWDWWGGGAYGGRRFAGTFPIWALALSFTLQRVTSTRFRGIAVALAIAVAAPLLALQWRTVAAHYHRRFSWEATVPFDERVRIGTGRSIPGYAVIGNPFAFPANAVFAIRHGVPLQRYDRAIGPYLLDERVATTNPLLTSKRTETVLLSAPGAIAFFGRGVEQTRNGAAVRHGAGELIVPLNRPGSFDLDVGLAGTGARLTWAFNGQPVAGPPFHIEARWVKRGINILRVEGDGAIIRDLTLTEGPEWPPAWTTEYAPARR
jgi:hypothetical protein